MNLYKVVCKGMTSSFTNETCHGIAYVVADDAGEAYNILRKDLDNKNLGFWHERALDRVELIAEQGDYPDCRLKLYLKEKRPERCDPLCPPSICDCMKGHK